MYEIKNYQAVVDQAAAMVEQIDPANGLVQRVTFVMTVPQHITRIPANLPLHLERLGEQMSWIYNIVGAKAKLVRRNVSKSMLFNSTGKRAPAHLIISDYEVEFSNPEFMMAWTPDARRALLAFARGVMSLREDYGHNEEFNDLANLVHSMMNVSHAPWFVCDGCEEEHEYKRIIAEHGKQRSNAAIQSILQRVCEMDARAFFNTDLGGDLVAEDGAPIREWVLKRARYMELVFTTFTHRCIGVKGTPTRVPWAFESSELQLR